MNFIKSKRGKCCSLALWERVSEGRVRGRFGFTLAETLITIGIIGVVSALTIPSLYTKIQHKILVEQFKKAYATANQALKMVQEENEKEYLCYLDGLGSYKESECSEFYKNFFTVQKTPKPSTDLSKYKYKYKNQTQIIQEGGSVPNSYCSLNDGFKQVYLLPNGIIYFVSSSNFFAVDINGNAGPNKWGYDAFYITLIKDTNNESAPLKFGQNTCYMTEKGGYTFAQMLKEIKK